MLSRGWQFLQQQFGQPVRSALIAGICVSYFVFALGRGPQPGLNGYTTEYYGLLADAFRAGQTSLALPPRDELLALPNPYDAASNYSYRLHDASLYRGKYYLYFGPAPAILLFLPYRVLTGSVLPNRIAIPLFCVGAFLFASGIFRKLAADSRWNLPRWLELSVITFVGCSPFFAFLLRRALFYEVPIAAACFLLMAGFYAMISAFEREPVSLWCLAASGLCFGLASGCRPYLLLVAAVMPLAIGFWSRRMDAAVACAVPVMICAALLAGYNYARFGNPLEVGISYQLTEAPAPAHGIHVRSALFLPTVSGLLFHHPSFDTTFPYVHPASVYVYTGFEPPNHWYREPTLGAVAASPVTLLGMAAILLLWLPQFRGAVGARLTRNVIAGLSLAALSILVVLGCIGWVAARYTADFGPLFALAGCCMAVAIWQVLSAGPRWKQLLFQSTVIVLAVYSAALYLSMPMPRLELIRQAFDSL